MTLAQVPLWTVMMHVLLGQKTHGNVFRNICLCIIFGSKLAHLFYANWIGMCEQFIVPTSKYFLVYGTWDTLIFSHEKFISFFQVLVEQLHGRVSDYIFCSRFGQTYKPVHVGHCQQAQFRHPDYTQEYLQIFQNS